MGGSSPQERFSPIPPFPAASKRRASSLMARKPEQDPGEPEGSFCLQSRTEDKREEVVVKCTPPSARVRT